MQEREQFIKLVNMHKGSVFRLAYGYLRNRDDAEDVVQEVFLKFHRFGGSFDSDEHAKLWLLRVTINECTSVYRALRLRPENIDDYIDTLEMPEKEHDGELVRQLMALPTRYRTVLYLYYFEGYSTHEVADLLGVPDATVRTRLARGRAKLKDVLDEGGTR